MFLEVRDGVIHEDKKSKITTVTFTDEQCDIEIAGVTITVNVNFTLTRARL
jgi:hypothetical protein